MTIIINGEIHSSKNSRQIYRNRKTGAPFVAKSRQSKADESMLEHQLLLQVAEWERMTKGMSYPVYVVFHFRRRTRAAWDFSNLIQGVADAMVKAGYLPDDDVTHFVPVYGGYEVCSRNPGVDFWAVDDYRIRASL